MSQGELFAATKPAPIVALQTWRLAPACAYGMPTVAGTVHALGWMGPHHCFWCFVDVERACRAFRADVAAGKYDAHGYTPAERRAQQKKRAAA